MVRIISKISVNGYGVTFITIAQIPPQVYLF